MKKEINFSSKKFILLDSCIPKFSTPIILNAYNFTNLWGKIVLLNYTLISNNNNNDNNNNNNNNNNVKLNSL